MFVVPYQRSRLHSGSLGRLANAREEEDEPGRPLAVRSHPLQQGVVLVAIALEIRREVQEGAPQTHAVDKE